jgi:hypothetical protein
MQKIFCVQQVMRYLTTMANIRHDMVHDKEMFILGECILLRM